MKKYLVLLLLVPFNGIYSLNQVDRVEQICYASNLDPMTLRFFVPLSNQDCIKIKGIDPHDIITLIVDKVLDNKRAVVFKEGRATVLENVPFMDKYKSIVEILRKASKDTTQNWFVTIFYATHSRDGVKAPDSEQLEKFLDERRKFWICQKEVSSAGSSGIPKITEIEYNPHMVIIK